MNRNRGGKLAFSWFPVKPCAGYAVLPAVPVGAGIVRYGFHGLSYERACRREDRTAALRAALFDRAIHVPKDRRHVRQRRATLIPFRSPVWVSAAFLSVEDLNSMRKLPQTLFYVIDLLSPGPK
jgi:hypothetical protein